MDVLVMNEDRLDCVQGRTETFDASNRVYNVKRRHRENDINII